MNSALKRALWPPCVWDEQNWERTGLMPNPSLFQSFEKAVELYADRPAVRAGERMLTFSDLRQASLTVAEGLMTHGIQRGDRVAIWGVNSVDWVVAGLAIQAVGGVLVPIGTRLRGREVSAILTAAQVRAVFCDSGFGSYDFVRALQDMHLPRPFPIVVMDQLSHSDGSVISLAELRRTGIGVDSSALAERIAGGSGDDLADILFTSGTTGLPKGVAMTHAQSLFACKVQQEEMSRFRVGEVFAVTFPFAHNAGYRAGWQVSLLNGVCVVPVPVVEAGALLKLIERERVNYLPAAPAVLQALLAHPERENTNLSSLRMVATGGTTVPVKLVEEMLAKLGPGAQIGTSYGLTEAAGSVTATQPEDGPEVIAQTCGRPFSCVDLKILGPDGRDVVQGETGEIALRAPQVTLGYHDNPEANRTAFTKDGYLLTGDAGWIDAAGNLHIADRMKDMFIVGGFNCYPAEIENIMGFMPGIAAAAVVGVADERLGQVGRAYVVRRDDRLSQEDVFAWCRAEMANYKVPRSVVFVDALPLNATGKVDKAVLRKQE